MRRIPETEHDIQPWVMAGMSQEDFMHLAEHAEQNGARLVIQTFVNAYVDPMGDGDQWVIEWFDYTDYRTGQRIGGHSPMDEEAPDELQNIFVVKRLWLND